MNRRLLEPYQKAFDRVAENDGKLILEDTREQLDRDMEKAFMDVGIEAKRKAADAEKLDAFKREIESDFAREELKVEERVSNLVESAIGKEEDFIDGLVIDFE
jgi:hypothetical protein